MNADPLVEMLDVYTPPFGEVARDWDAVLERIRPRRRRRALALAAPAFGAAVTALVILWPFAAPPSVLGKALAAIGGNPTIHVVLDVPNAAEQLDLKTGRTRALSSREEFWADAKLGTVVTRTLDGHPAERVLLTRGAWGPAVAQWRPFVTGYRKQLQHGSFHVVSTGTIDGQTVKWIAGGVPTPLREGGSIVQEIAISTTTYRPLYVRDLLNGKPLRGSSARVVVAESLPRQAAHFEHASINGGPGGGQTSFPGGSTGIPTTLAAARAAMQPDPVIPRANIGQLRRSWIGLPDYLLPPANSYRDQVNGLALYYGSLDGYGYPSYRGRYISINELPSRHDAYTIWGPGFFRSGEALITSSPVSGEAIATLRTHGLFVAIQASSKAAATNAALALVR